MVIVLTNDLMGNICKKIIKAASAVLRCASSNLNQIQLVTEGNADIPLDRTNSSNLNYAVECCSGLKKSHETYLTSFLIHY